MPVAYQRLPNETGDEKYLEPRRSRFSHTLVVLLFIICIETTALAAVALHRSKQPSPRPPRIYCPPPNTSWKKSSKSTRWDSTTQKSPFQVPSSPALDDAWEDLYQFGVSRIPKSEAALLPNKTSPIPGDPGYYIAQLDVFHQLHCLNLIRKALDPAYYPEWNITKAGFARGHISHCVEWIRHSIMCQSDTSVIVWQWDPKDNGSFPEVGVPHTCRNFDAIRQWGKDNTLAGKFNSSTYVPDDLPTPPYIY